MTFIMLMFPFVFMIHEFEELFFLDYFKDKILPTIETDKKIIREILSSINKTSKSKFAIIVIEELVVVVIITIFSLVSQNYTIFLALVVAYTIHLLVHIIQTIIIKKYTPMIVTSVLTSFYSLYVFNYYAINNIETQQLFLISVLITALISINLVIMHKIIK